MFYKIVYGLVAIPLPSYFVHPEVHVHSSHALSLIQTNSHICLFLPKFIFPNVGFLWNKLPADLVLLSDLDSFKTGVSKINHINP